MDSSTRTPAHVPQGAWEHPAPPQSVPAPYTPPGTPGHWLSSQAWGPLGTALPVTSCQGGWGEGKQGLQMASCGRPAVGTPQPRRSRKSGAGVGEAVSPISRARTVHLGLPGPTARLTFPNTPTEGVPTPVYRGGN